MLKTTDTYTNIAARLNDALNVSGGEVSNLAVDLLNRAQSSLWFLRDWEGLKKRANLTLSGLTATLPTDFGREITIGCDSDSDGKIDQFFFNNGDADNGYRVNSTFAKATGFAITITLYAAPGGTVICEYMPLLTDFTGSGTEYSFFPAELLLTQALVIHYTESGEENNQLTVLNQKLEAEIRKFEAVHQYRNQDMGRLIKDAYGSRVQAEGETLDGSKAYVYTTDDPSTDRA